MYKFDFHAAIVQGAFSTFSGSSRASKGILPKVEIIQNGVRYFIKTGSVTSGIYSKLSPVSEAMACDLGRLLWLSIAEYQLFILPEGIVEDSLGEVYVTASPCFYDDSPDSAQSYSSMAVSIHDMVIPNAADYYQLICERYYDYTNDIDAMIVFDYIIDNPDRHLNNLGFIEDAHYEDAHFAPYYDHGQSLLSMLSEEYLTFVNKDLGLMYDRKADAKPFNSKQCKAIKKVVRNPYLGINPNLTAKDFDNWIAPYREHLSEARADAILTLVQRRYKYVQTNILTPLG